MTRKAQSEKDKSDHQDCRPVVSKGTYWAGSSALPYYFPRAAVTSYHKRECLKQQKLILSFESEKSEIQVLARPRPLESSGENLFQALLSFWSGQQSLACSHTAPVPASGVMWPSPCLSLHMFLLIRTVVRSVHSTKTSS